MDREKIRKYEGLLFRLGDRFDQRGLDQTVGSVDQLTTAGCLGDAPASRRPAVFFDPEIHHLRTKLAPFFEHRSADERTLGADDSAWMLLRGGLHHSGESLGTGPGEHRPDGPAAGH